MPRLSAPSRRDCPTDCSPTARSRRGSLSANIDETPTPLRIPEGPFHGETAHENNYVCRFGEGRSRHAGGLLPRFSLLGRAARLLAAVLALAVPLLAVLVLSDAAPAQAQTSQPTPDKLVLEFRRWPYRDYINALAFIPGPHIAELTVLGHYQLRWPAPDYPIYEFQFVVDTLSEYVRVQGRWSNVDDEGEHYEYVRVIGPYEAVKTIRMRGKNYRAAKNCVGTGPCEGAGEWSDPPKDARRKPPPLPLGQVEAPTITGSPALSESGSDGAWTAGETAEVTLTFSEAVTVDTTGGTPSVGLTLGGTEARSATYLRGSGTTALVFAYTLTDADGSHTSLLVPIDSLALNGGTIRSQATGADVALEHSGAAKAGSTSNGVRDEGDTPNVESTFTASFSALPQGHDGSGAFTFELHFSAAPEGLSYTTVAGGLLDVTGATVNKARRLTAGSNLGWEVTVTPSQSGDIAIRLPARACTETNAVCVGGSPLASATTATVRGVPFTASFSGVPAEHDGAAAFDIRFHLSAEPATLSYRTVQNGLFNVTGGSIEKASRLAAGKNNGWSVRIDPTGLGDVTVRVNGTSACDTAPGVCTSDGRKLAGGLQAVIAGPAALSVANAEVQEGADATLDFTVTLSKARFTATTVDYASSNGTATAGSDYTATSGRLTFGRLETSKTVSVPVLDDAVDEGSETMSLTLSNPSPSSVRLAGASATGTITNSDPLQKMWLSRFGRTVADHVVGAVAGRLSAPLGGAQVTVGGQSIDLSRTGDGAVLVDALTGLAGVFGAPGGATARGETAPGTWPDRHGGAWERPAAGVSSPARSITGRELLLGSSFHLALDGEDGGGGPGLAAWGRATVGGFDGQGGAETGAMRMDGEVITGILGADAQWGRWLAGLALSQSEGEGTFEQPDAGHRGTVESDLTSVNPYLRFEVSDRLSTWGLLGFGAGEMTMTEAARGERAKTVSQTDIKMRLAAVGARGALLDAATSGGFDLAVKADAFLVETEWEKVSNERDTQAGASRLRLVLEGSQAFELSESAKLTPGLEFGLRHDGGDAETGTGVEVGGSMRYADAASGLSVEARGRTLIAHEASGFEEWGASASVHLDPGAEGRGLSFNLAPTLGTASSGVDRLWSLQNAHGLTPEGEFEVARSLEAQIGYGLGAFGDRGLAKPYAGLSLGEGGARTWRGGVHWTFGQSLDLGLEGSRNEAANDNEPDHGIGFRLTARW